MVAPLTQVAIDKLKPGPSRREYPDGKVTGLNLIVQASGSMSWGLRYRFNGWPTKFTIGSYPTIGLAAARKAAQDARGKIARGIDPAREKQTAKAAARENKAAALDLVENVVAEFIERHAKAKTRDWKETERLMRSNVVAAWQGRRLSTIGKADVHRLLDAIVDRGAPVGANRVFAQLRKMCSWAVSRGIIASSPCEGVTRPSPEKPRDRVLSADELSLVWQASESLGFPFGPIMRLLILTGQRRDEVGGLKWVELDIEKKVWTLPGARAKNRRRHEIPLSTAAIEIIEALPRFDSEFCFSSGRTAPSGWSAMKRRLDSRIAELNGGEAIPTWTLHDIRRSVASGMASIALDLHIVEKCLNHVSGTFSGVLGIYQRHKFEAEKRDALDRWAAHVERIVGGEAQDNVVEMRARG